MEIEVNWIALGITAFIIVVVAASRLWKRYQKGWADLHVEKAEYNGDITNLIPHAMRERDRKWTTWHYE